MSRYTVFVSLPDPEELPRQDAASAPPPHLLLRRVLFRGFHRAVAPNEAPRRPQHVFSCAVLRLDENSRVRQL